MKSYDIVDNHLLIYDDGVLIEDATENMNECYYCRFEPSMCGREESANGGQFCDGFEIRDEYDVYVKKKPKKKPKFRGKYANYWKVNSLKGGY